MTPAIRITVLTYRRPQLLERALRSLTSQTFGGWSAEVLNDDPADERPRAVIAAIGDARIRLDAAAEHRGGTAGFNHAFRSGAEPFAAVLEDDNWWEPGFLAAMLAALEAHPTVELACGNEQIWREYPDGTWRDTGRTARPPGVAPQEVPWRALDACGGALLCNSALVFRTRRAEAWRTPSSIPIDVTEHYRERVIPHPFLLVPATLVNYAETVVTHRSRRPEIWASHQVLLVGSVFALAPAAARGALATALWRRARDAEAPFATTLLHTAACVAEAAALARHARPREKLRHFAARLRHPSTSVAVRRTLVRHAAEWRWLRSGPFAEFMQHSPVDAVV